MASESVAPPSISSQTSIRLFFSTPGLDWLSRMRILRRMGKPASCRIDNWRVKVVRALDLTPPSANVFPFRRAFFWSVDLRAFLMEIFVTKYPICRIVACASSWVGASRTSLIP